ncbi:MAG: preprotein translocase subunit SecY [Clostridia bacterium]|nr:preprotein translocase subunit SecY [Clostridia bacterium]
MLQTLKNAWVIKEIRNKILFTVMIIMIFRIGSVIPVPFVDTAALKAGGTSNEFFNYLSILTGGGLEYGAIFALSVTPYINSSIIIQLLTVVFKRLQEWSKEGEEGQKKLAQLTRWSTAVLAMIQGIAYFIYLKNSNYLTISKGKEGAMWFAGIVVVLAFTAGSTLVMWLGEQIDEKGIGNGISIILFAGILSRGPQAFALLYYNLDLGKYVEVVGIVLVFLIVIMFVVWMTHAERRIPIQYAKRVVGNKMYGGQNTHIPIKVNMSGVMPIIFSSSILMLPTMVLSFMGTPTKPWAIALAKVLKLFSVQGTFYAIVYFLLIIGFAYFYATIQFNPVEMANNLRKNGGAIPGIRPGQPTTDFISKILSRITLLGALLLSVIAILPIIVGNVGEINVSLGGTSMLIMVGVALDVVRSLESQMMMRHYKGFLD